MHLCYQRGRFLYEVRPDIMPYGFLTPLETELWADYYKALKDKG
jgi:hypothetical protein